MYASEVLKIAEAEIGYKGHMNVMNLDDKESTGSGYYTKYARDCWNGGGNHLFNGSK